MKDKILYEHHFQRAKYYKPYKYILFLFSTIATAARWRRRHLVSPKTEACRQWTCLPVLTSFSLCNEIKSST
jgi:hypothetical protein